MKKYKIICYGWLWKFDKTYYNYQALLCNNYHFKDTALS